MDSGVLAVGLMSGTSVDGVDAALVAFPPGDGRPGVQLVQFASVPYTKVQRQRILAVQRPDAPVSEICALDVEVGGWFADAVDALLRASGVPPERVAVIGSHGQTVAHYPRGVDGRGTGFTLQIGSAAVLAERTGIDVVSDFRARDLAAGGEGAPLVPAFDQAFLASRAEARVSLNIGGIANITAIGRDAGPEECLGFDTGPGNMVLDLAVEMLSGGARWFDEDGEWAAQGKVVPELLVQWLRHPYYRRKPPKTTGREEFGRPYVQPLVEDALGRGTPAQDILRTLTALVAQTIADAIASVAPEPFTLVVAGGGGHNRTLLAEIAQRTAGLARLIASDDLGIPSDAKEAMAFAYLAWQHVRRLPANLPRITGAAGPRILGNLTPGAVAGGTGDAGRG